MARKPVEDQNLRGWRGALHEIIFEADTPAGKAFDVILIVSIMLSVTVVMLDSMAETRERYGDLLYNLEWFFTILFTIEYVLRLVCLGKPSRYAFSFFGIVDLMAIVPTYLDIFLEGSHFLLALRILRLLRVFRVLKLVPYVAEANAIKQGLLASRRKVMVFLFGVMTLMVVMGSLMYVIEGEKNGFDSIPRSIYWAIVTVTTVGYGDISPQTGLGQTLAAMAMIIGYAIIAIPSGIVTVELSRALQSQISTQACPECGSEGHDTDARHCKRCGAEL